MAKFKEIEVKWLAEGVERAEFNAQLRRLFQKKGYLFKFIRVMGPDTYFMNEHGQTIRHRISKNTHELTSKLRLYKKSIKSRKEVNVKLALNQPVEDVFELLGMVGLSRVVQIVKDCDIYFISGSKAHVSMVWYRVVDDRGSAPRTFIEVEVEGLSHQKSLKVLKMWMNRFKKMFKLKNRDVSDDSLFEIYSGKRYGRA